MRNTIIVNLEGKDWRVTRLDSLDVRPLDEGDERRGVVRYCPESERDEARDWVRRITAESRVLTCVYCGHAYPPGSPEHGAEVLTEHIKTCEKHPMRELQKQAAELATLKSALAFIRGRNYQLCPMSPAAPPPSLDRGATPSDSIMNLALALGWKPPEAQS